MQVPLGGAEIKRRVCQGARVRRSKAERTGGPTQRGETKSMATRSFGRRRRVSAPSWWKKKGTCEGGCMCTRVCVSVALRVYMRVEVIERGEGERAPLRCLSYCFLFITPLNLLQHPSTKPSPPFPSALPAPTATQAVSALLWTKYEKAGRGVGAAVTKPTFFSFSFMAP